MRILERDGQRHLVLPSRSSPESVLYRLSFTPRRWMRWTPRNQLGKPSISDTRVFIQLHHFIGTVKRFTYFVERKRKPHRAPQNMSFDIANPCCRSNQPLWRSLVRNVVLLGAAAAARPARPRPARPEDPSKIQAGREDDTAPDTDDLQRQPASQPKPTDRMCFNSHVVNLRSTSDSGDDSISSSRSKFFESARNGAAREPLQTLTAFALTHLRAR